MAARAHRDKSIGHRSGPDSTGRLGEKDRNSHRAIQTAVGRNRRRARGPSWLGGCFQPATLPSFNHERYVHNRKTSTCRPPESGLKLGQSAGLLPLRTKPSEAVGIGRKDHDHWHVRGRWSRLRGSELGPHQGVHVKRPSV
eukprot:180994-Hanusia_phi.AAC.5